MTIKFKTPPINELVISTYFNPPLFDLRSEHIGLFWSKIKEDFPTATQQGPVGGIADVIGQEFFPMPRYWFTSGDEINLIQVQKNAFMFNWRRRDSEYPHFFDNLKPSFDKYFAAFEKFVRDETETKSLPIDLCELSYINVIEHCEYWSGPADTPNVIPSFCVPETGMSFSGNPSFNCVYAYPLDTDLQLSVKIRDAQTTRDPEIPILVFEIRASGRLGEATKSEADAWFERAHEAIGACFLGMTNKDIQHRYWKPVEEAE